MCKYGKIYPHVFVTEIALPSTQLDDRMAPKLDVATCSS